MGGGQSQKWKVRSEYSKVDFRTSKFEFDFLISEYTIFNVSKFTLFFGSNAWGHKTKETYYSLLSLKMITFVLFPQASQPSMNFHVSEISN